MAIRVKDKEANRANPVRHVVDLLQKMKVQLEKEGDEESTMYDKMVCWCETNNKEKTQAIDDAKTKDVVLMSEIKRRSSRYGELSADIATMKKQVAEGKKALAQVIAIREKEAAANSKEETQLVQAITNLKDAISVLSDVQGKSSLLQKGSPMLSSLQVLLRDAGLTYELLQAERPGKPRTSFLALGAEDATMTTNDFVSSAVSNALNVHGGGVPRFPLRFAERMVQRALANRHKHPSAAVPFFLQLGQGQHQAPSGQIYGVLKQMLEDFQTELEGVRNTEKNSDEEYGELRKAKDSENVALQEKLDALESEAAANQKALSDAKEDLELTRRQQSADIKFLRSLKTQCNDMDKEWQQRSDTRTAELKAVSEAIAVLAADESREILNKGVMLLQERALMSRALLAMSMRMRAAMRRAAADDDFLGTDDLAATWQSRGGGDLPPLPVASPPPPPVAAAAPHTVQLAAVQAAVASDDFGEVKDMIDKLVLGLKGQQGQEEKLKAYCQKELGENKRAARRESERKNQLELKKDSLKAQVVQLGKDLGDVKKKIQGMNDDMDTAKKERSEQNSEYKTLVVEQTAIQTVLKKALEKLEAFYKRGVGKKLSLRQRRVRRQPVKFTAYKVNEGSAPVMGLLKDIMSKSELLVQKAKVTEKKAQEDFDKLVSDSRDEISELSDAVEDKTEALATAKIELGGAENDLENANDRLDSLKASLADFHKQCDWILANFKVRAKARLEEIEAIQAAKAMLSGAGGR